MTTTVTYLDALRAELTDVPESERDALLEDVASSGDDDAALEARLGPPAQFARELRSEAGLQTAGGPAPSRPSLRDRAREIVARATPLGRELAPLGWLVRGYLAAVAIAFTVGAEWFYNRPGVFSLRGVVWDALWLCVVCVAVSVVIGVAMRLAKRRSAAVTVVNVLFALGALWIAPTVVDQFRHRGESPSASSVTSVIDQTPGLSIGGVPVGNIYPYSRDGRPLYDVRLYDENGNALEIGRAAVDPDRRVPRTQLGTMAFNAFPIRYFEPRSTRVRTPRQGFKRRAPLVRPKAIRSARGSRRG
jgi:hypothetical protein